MGFGALLFRKIPEREWIFNVNSFEEVPDNMEGTFKSDSELIKEGIIIVFMVVNAKELLWCGDSIICGHLILMCL